MLKKVCNVPAERVVLAALCQFGRDAAIDLGGFLETEIFTSTLHQLTFKALESVLEQSVRADLPSIIAAGAKLGFEKSLEKEAESIRELFSAPISEESAIPAAKTLYKLYIARTAQNKHQQAINSLGDISGSESIDDILSMSEKPVFDLSLALNTECTSAPQVLGEAVDDYLIHTRENKGKQPGLTTPWKHYDRAIGGGIRRRTVNLIGARSKIGKSFIAENVALHLIRKNIPVLMLDTEMTAEDHLNRILANMSDVSIDDIETGHYTSLPIFEQEVKEAAAELKKLPYHYVSVAGKSFDQILSTARKWIVQEVGFEGGRTRDCLLIYDYMKLMSAGHIEKGLQEYQQIGFQITQLHNFVVDYDVPCLAFVQLNRDGISEESAAAISQSDRLLWLCTSFSIYKVKSQEEIALDGQEHGNRKLIPLHSRHGAGLDDGDYINLTFQGKYGRIKEGCLRSEVKRGSQKAANQPVVKGKRSAGADQSGGGPTGNQQGDSS